MAHPTILSLFSGVGGLDLGIRLACPRARVLGYVERDAYAAAVLMARMEDASLEPAPVWIGDVCDVDGGELRGRVDIICGGFPCQDISVAGKGVGIGGKRSGLWSEIVRLAREIRPRYLFLENVSAIITRGLDTVLADLAEIGFDAEWLCLRASDVGAPHRRERWFCLAHRDLDGCGLEWCGGVLNRERTTLGHDADGRDEALADAANDHGRRGERGAEAGARAHRAGADAGAVERAGGDGRRPLDDAELERDVQQQAEPLCTGWPSPDVAGRPFSPGPADLDAWRGVPEYLAPAVEPGLCRMAYGPTYFLDGGLGVREKYDPQAGPAGDFARWFRMCQVRLAEITGETPPGLLEATGCGDPLSPLPRDRTPGQADAEVQGVRRGNPKDRTPVEEERLRHAGMSQRVGQTQCEQKMGEARQDEDLRELREGVHAPASKGEDVQQGLCKKTRVEDEMRPVDIYRADRLRCCGNGVVPLQAAVAFVELVRLI